MTTTRKALLGACLALPLAYAGTALAAPPAGPRTITVPPGAVVLILPGAATTGTSPFTTPAAFPSGDPDPLLQLVAQQDAMMQGMMAQMNAAFAQTMFPSPMFPSMNGMIQAAMRGVPQAGQGAGMVFTSVSNGPGVCSERVVYSYPANGGKPRVTMTRSGNACGTPGTNGPLGVAQPVPHAGPQAPSVAPSHGPRLWTVSNPPEPIVSTSTPRS